MKVLKKVIAVLAIMMFTSLSSFATDPKAEQKIDTDNQLIQIQADSITHNTKTNEITASGNVVITQKHGSWFLKAEKAVIKTDENKKPNNSGQGRIILGRDCTRLAIGRGIAQKIMVSPSEDDTKIACKDDT